MQSVKSQSKVDIKSVINSNLKDRLKDTREKIKHYIKLSQELTKLTNHWLEIMAETKSYNEAYQTFTLSHIKKEDYGYSCRIYAPDGLIIDDLEKIRPAIESGLKCVFLFKLTDFKEMALVQFIKNVNCNDIPYAVQKVKPWECYAGVDASGQPLIFNMIKDNNVFISGNTRKGKSKANDHILTSTICSCTKNDIWIFLIQLDKEDLIIYEDAEQVMGFADDLEKADIVLTFIIKEMRKRTEIMRPLKKKGLANNIYEYNKNNPKNKFPMIMINIDEFSSLVIEGSDLKEVKLLKESIIDKLIKIAQIGGALGIYYIISVQRPTVDRIPSFLKAESNVKICFGVSNQKTSEVCLDNDMAVGLPPRRAVTFVNSEYSMLFTTSLPDSEVLRLIKPHLKPGHRTIFDIVKSKEKGEDKAIDKSKQGKVSLPSEQPEKPVVKLDFSKVSPDKDKLLEENIKKIPNFVPYNPEPVGRVKL
jgi:S-DNA-T family DNA segregation ATPase FtsK/SpoIIIE